MLNQDPCEAPINGRLCGGVICACCRRSDKTLANLSWKPVDLGNTTHVTQDQNKVMFGRQSRFSDLILQNAFSWRLHHIIWIVLEKFWVCKTASVQPEDESGEVSAPRSPRLTGCKSYPKRLLYFLLALTQWAQPSEPWTCLCNQR